MIRKASLAAAGAVLIAGVAVPQGRPIDWPNFGGDAQRSGWEKSDSRITMENVKDFQMVINHKMGSGPGGVHSLTPPVVVGQLISYKGFKELAIVAGAGDSVWALDADLDRVFWERKLTGSKPKDGACAGIVSAMPALTPPVSFGGPRPRPATNPLSPPVGAPAPPAPPAPTFLGGTGFGVVRPVFVVTSDGKLHALNTSTGEDQQTPVQFLPANSKASPLTVADGAIYTATSAACGDSKNAMWAIDLKGAVPTVASYPLKDGKPAGGAGFAIGSDGTVFVQIAGGSVQSLSSKLLEPLHAFVPAGGAADATPVVFMFKNHEFVAASGMDKRVYLLDGATLSVVSQTEPLAEGAAQGGLASWQTAAPANERWLIAPVSTGVVGLKVEDRDGKPALTKSWAAGGMTNPLAPVLTGGAAFVLDAGKAGGHATFHAFDALTGKELYSTGNQVKVPAQMTGLSIVNARVYFTTTDNNLYAFGVFLER